MNDAKLVRFAIGAAKREAEWYRERNDADGEAHWASIADRLTALADRLENSVLIDREVWEFMRQDRPEPEIKYPPLTASEAK